MNDYRTYYLAFSVFKGIGPVRLKDLIIHFGTVKNAWEGKTAELEKILGKARTEEFSEFRKTFSIQKYIEELERKGIQWITIEDKEYPALLKYAVTPAFILYVKGDISLLNSYPAIAIVGTRKVTNYGKQVTEMFTRDLVEAKFVTVSGLAFGVDSCAHETTIEGGGKTIAVLGCGVDCCFPMANQYIYDRIISTGGLIVSQFLPGSSPTTGTFPARNKIIAGLSLGTVVTEGSQDSGAIITAEYAFKYNRPVFAVPGPITSGLSKGPNGLLQKGAIAVTSAEDILKVLKIQKNQETQKSRGSDQIIRKSENPIELNILSFLELGPLHFDEIARKIGKPVKDVGSILSLMEIKGMVGNEGGIYSLL